MCVRRIVPALLAALTICACGSSHANNTAASNRTPSAAVVSTSTPTQAESVPPTPPPPSPSPEAPPTHNPALEPYQYDASAPFLPVYGAASQAWPSNLILGCRLPVYAGQSGSGGFVVFPGGQFIADPRSAVSLPPPPANYTPPPMMGIGFQQLTFDHALTKWLPVTRDAVSPDGKQYAYSLRGGKGIYVVDAASGTQTELAADGYWWVIDVEQQGVYARSMTPSLEFNSGLWLVPFSGSPTQITANGYWGSVGGGAAYGTATSSVPQGATSTILRLDLKTVTSQPWFEAPGTQGSQVIGFDAHGSPIIQDYFQGGSQIWIVPGPGQGYVIENNPPFGGGGVEPVADKNGIWFGGGNQIFLFVPGSGTFVAAQVGGLPAGDCV